MPHMSKKKKTYEYEDNRTFQLALEYFNRRWEKPIKEKIPEKQEIFVEKLYVKYRGEILQCRACRVHLIGEKYYEDRNRVSKKLCRGCMGYKLKKKVGTIRERITEELKWLDSPQINKHSNVIFTK